MGMKRHARLSQYIIYMYTVSSIHYFSHNTFVFSAHPPDKASIPNNVSITDVYAHG